MAMHSLTRLMLAFALGSLATSPSFAVTVTEQFSVPKTNEFLSHSAEGWYWYKDPIEEPEEEEEKKPLPPLPMPVTPPTAQKDPPPAPFTQAWVKQMLPKYMEKAWDNPTEENVTAYFLVQRFALDRANAFSDMAQRVVLGNTALDETMRRSWANPGQTQANLEYAKKTQEMMAKVAKHAGVWFFFKSDCAYCEQQAPILGFLEQEKFPVLAVSMDGGQLKSQQFANTFMDAGHGKMLGVTSTPTLFLVSTEGKFDALGVGVMSLMDLRNRILLAAVRNGWLTQEEFNEARPLMNLNQQRDLSKEIPKLLEAQADPTKLLAPDESMKRLAAVTKNGTDKIPMDENNFIDPNILVALVGQRNQGQIDTKQTEVFTYVPPEHQKEK